MTSSNYLNMPLVDELDIQSCLTSHTDKSEDYFNSSLIKGVVIGKDELKLRGAMEEGCIRRGGGGKNRMQSDYNSASSSNSSSNTVNGGGQACPCCQRYVHHANCQTTTSTTSSIPQPIATSAPFALSHQPNFASHLTMAAPPLVPGDTVRNSLGQFTIDTTIVQGWLHKKGTGGDFWGGRWWKPRWVTLALASANSANNNSISSSGGGGGLVPIPILLTHRAPGVPYPVTIIPLNDATVVMAVDRTNGGDERRSSGGKSVGDGGGASDGGGEEEWNRHCFQIVHTKASTSNNNATTATVDPTRIFTAPLQERNEWAFAINKTLMDYEKRLVTARRTEANAHNSSHRRDLSAEFNIEATNGGRLSRSPIRPASSLKGRMRSPSPTRMGGGGLPPTSPRRLMRSLSPLNSRGMSLPLSPKKEVVLELELDSDDDDEDDEMKLITP